MRRLLVLAGVVALPPASATAQCLMAREGVAFDFVAGTRSLYSTDFGGDAMGEFPSSLIFLQGAMEVVRWDGKHALKASAPSVLAVPLAAPLPENFTVELGVVNRNTKQVGAHTVKIYGGRRFLSDFQTEATRAEYGLITWGVTGGGASAEAPLSSEDADACMGQEQTVRLLVDGSRVKLYADQRKLATVPNARFHRGNGLVIGLEGRDDADNAVYLTRIRISQSGGGAPAGPTTANSSQPATAATTAAASTGTTVAKSAPVTATISKAPLDTSTALAPPTGVRAEQVHYRGRILLHWDSMPGAVGYAIVRWMSDGKYAGANPVETPVYGPERTQGVTIELSQGPVKLGVVADYGNGQFSAPSTPVSIEVPRWNGRYRISVLGFKVDRETLDDPLETDGKRDEVYLRAAVVERGPDQQAVGGVSQIQTYVHGDVNADDWRMSSSPNYRIRAGSASTLGGLKSGDGFPTATPWQRATTSNYPKSFPLHLWEGDLWQGDNTVQIAIQLWETDQRPGQALPGYEGFSPEAVALERSAPATGRLEPTLAGKVILGAAAGAVLAPAVAPLLLLSAPALVPTAAAVLVASQTEVRLPTLPQVTTPLDSLSPVMAYNAGVLKVEGAMNEAMVSAANALYNGVVGYLTEFEQKLALDLNVQDRPLGIASTGSGLKAVPSIVTLNIENAEGEALSGNGPANLGPGVYAIRFEDKLTSQGGNGIYTVYLQVERLR